MDPCPPAWQELRRTWGPFARDGVRAEKPRSLSVASVDDDSSAPTAEQISAYAFLSEHGPALRETVLAAIAADYAKKRVDWADLDDDLDEWMPELAGPHELVDRIELSDIHVHRVIRGGLAYVGLELSCTWDEEHGAGVMLHGSRVVAVGGSDTARLEWIAEQDAESQPR